LKSISGPNNRSRAEPSGEKNKKLDPFAKLFQAMRCRNMCWQGHRTTYWS